MKFSISDIVKRIAIPALIATTAFMNIFPPASASATEMTGQDSAPKISLDAVTVTETREAQNIAETPASVSVISGKEIDEIKPASPSEVMNRIPGVWVNVTSGEGHITSIRQPLTTSPVYLYLEDGVPTRSTGFFNHNALYEVNVPMSGGIEVIKGPGSALYGSDAIGGVVNILTRPVPKTPSVTAGAEAGSFGFARGMLSAGNTWENNGLRADLNYTKTNGWRKKTAYNRQGATLKWLSEVSTRTSASTVLAYSNIDQETAGTSRLSLDDFWNNPTKNYTPISFRKVKAVRLSSSIAVETGENSELSLTPYYRNNYMSILPNWSLSYDPSQYVTKNDSFGLMAKYRMDFEPYRTRIIAGADFDLSPGAYNEDAINSKAVDKIFSSYTVGDKIYDYKSTYSAVSPYLHAETSPSENIRVTAGVRVDGMKFDYKTNLAAVDTGSHRIPANTAKSYSHLSPKLGVTYDLGGVANLYAGYRHAFRAPSSEQLFRQGVAADTVDLKPVKADSYDAGIRSAIGDSAYVELSAYYMVKTDDIMSYKHADGLTETLNAGKTSHRGIEGALDYRPLEWLTFGASVSYAVHKYESWSPKEGVSYNGKDISMAPRLIADLRAAIEPALLKGVRIEAEWFKLGGYYLDDDNTQKYNGHDLINLRADYTAGAWDFSVRWMNLGNRRYAETGTYTQTRGVELAPGLPSAVYAGVTYRFE